MNGLKKVFIDIQTESRPDRPNYTAWYMYITLKTWHKLLTKQNMYTVEPRYNEVGYNKMFFFLTLTQ